MLFSAAFCRRLEFFPTIMHLALNGTKNELREFAELEGNKVTPRQGKKKKKQTNKQKTPRKMLKRKVIFTLNHKMWNSCDFVLT